MHATMQGTMQLPQAAMPVSTANPTNLEARHTLEQLFFTHKERVFRAAYRVTGSASDAEDVLQTVFLRLLRQGIPAEINNPGSYLHRAAVNAALDLLRSRKETQSFSGEEGPEVPQPESATSNLESAELREWLRRALPRLNPRWAEMFVLRFIEDYSNREIARMMKTSPAVVAVLLHRTRSQLKKDFLAFTRGKR